MATPDYPRTVVSQLVTETNELTSYVLQLLDVVTQDTDRILAEIKTATDQLDAATAELTEVKDSTITIINDTLSDMNDIYLVFQRDSQRIMLDLSNAQAEIVVLNNNLDLLTGRTGVLDTGIRELEVLYTALDQAADGIDLRIRLLQSATSALEGRTTTLQTQLNSMSVDVQNNKTDLAAMNNLLQSMTANVGVLADTVEDNIVLVDALSVSVLDLQSKANTALSVATQALDQATVIQHRVDVLVVDVDDIESRLLTAEGNISNYEGRLLSIREDITEITQALIDLDLSLDTKSLAITATLNSLSDQVTQLAARVSPLMDAIANLESRATALDNSYSILNTTISNQILDATQAANSATSAAVNLTSSVASMTASYNRVSIDLNEIQTEIATLDNNLIAYSVDINTKYQDSLSQYSMLQVQTSQLTNQMVTLHGQVTAMRDEVSTDTDHVNAQVAYIDARAIEFDTLYLHKTAKAADSDLIDGKDLTYLLHDDNVEAKLAVSPKIVGIEANISAIQSLLQSDNGALDTLQEIVNYIELNRDSLNSLTIASIAGLQIALDGKLAVGSNAVSATKLVTPRAVNGTNFDGSAAITTALWGTARTLTIGNTGKSVNGSANVSWTLAEMGAVPLTRQVNGRALTADITLTPADVGAHAVVNDVTVAAGKKVILATPVAATTQYTVTQGMNVDGSTTFVLRNVTAASDVLPYVIKIAPNGAIDFGGAVTINGSIPYSSNYLPDWSIITSIPSTASRWPAFSEVTSVPATASRWPTYAEVTGKPATFTPSAHTHQWVDLTDKPSTFTPSAHNHYNFLSQGSLNMQTGTVDPVLPGLSLSDMGTGYSSTGGVAIQALGASQAVEMDISVVSGVPQMDLRGKLAGTGSSWYAAVRVLTSDNYNVYAPGKTGVGASGTWGISVTGNAATATTLATARTIGLSGVTATATSFNGSANIVIPVTAVPTSLLTGVVADAQLSGSYTGLTNLSGSGVTDFNVFRASSLGTATIPSFSWAGDTNTGVYSPVAGQLAITVGGVQKALFNASGVTASTFIGALTGNASTATTLATARTIGLSGVTATATSFNGSANIVIPITAIPTSLLTGVLADAQLSGSYTGLTNLTGSGTVDFAFFLGNATDTVTAPSFSWTGDTNTGIYQPAADQLAVTTGGVQRALFNSSGVTASTFIGALSGNAATATKLATARTINGVAFDGTANITVTDVLSMPKAGGTFTGAVSIVPSVDTSSPFTIHRAGGTNTSITFSSSTTSLYFGRSAASEFGFGSGLDISAGASVRVNVATGTVSATTFSGALSGNAATATKLATARTINGVAFDGSANINIVVDDPSKLPLAGGTVTGLLSVAKISLRRDLNVASGYSYYSNTYNTWQTYMGPAGTSGMGFLGNITTPTGSLVSGWAMRSVIENSSGYGWTWESMANGGTIPTIQMEVSSVTGDLRTRGDIEASGGKVSLTASASMEYNSATDSIDFIFA